MGPCASAGAGVGAGMAGGGMTLSLSPSIVVNAIRVGLGGGRRQGSVPHCMGN
jgi:hypothetical protein